MACSLNPIPIQRVETLLWCVSKAYSRRENHLSGEFHRRVYTAKATFLVYFLMHLFLSSSSVRLLRRTRVASLQVGAIRLRTSLYGFCTLIFFLKRIAIQRVETPLWCVSKVYSHRENHLSGASSRCVSTAKTICCECLPSVYLPRKLFIRQTKRHALYRNVPLLSFLKL